MSVTSFGDHQISATGACRALQWAPCSTNDEIGPGSVVLAYDFGEEAWYEAVVHVALVDGFRLT